MKTFTRIIGIDPGAHGALVFYDKHTGKFVAHKTETGEMHEAMKDALVGTDWEHNCVAYVEKVGGFIAGKNLPGSAMFKMGENFGFWLGMLAAYRVRTILVRPQDWQKGISGVAGLAGVERKRALCAEARRRFPTLKVTLANCDALLIADYARGIEGAKQ